MRAFLPNGKSGSKRSKDKRSVDTNNSMDSLRVRTTRQKAEVKNDDDEEQNNKESAHLIAHAHKQKLTPKRQNQLQLDALFLQVFADRLCHLIAALFVELHIHAKGETAFDDRVLRQHIQTRIVGKVNLARGKDQIHRRQGKRIHGFVHGARKRPRRKSAERSM